MKKRAVLLSLWVLAVVFGGLGYYLWFSITGLGVPCLFYEITSLMCPGCGVTRLCIALLKLDFYSAFKANAAIFTMLPFWAAVFGAYAFRYIKNGTRKMLKWQEYVLYFSAAILVVYDVVRNIMMLSGN